MPFSQSVQSGSGSQSPTERPAHSRVSYRPDIDGLRALAVLAVVGFHAFVRTIKGGFIGVDVFFVISGYLITGIISGQLRDGTFSFPDFYNRRIRRIFPALVVVLVAATAFGWFELSPDQYKTLGLHTAAGGTFLSNVVLWKEAGYFDASSASKPLLHLWSLGIEEQFYIVWPVLLWASFRLRLSLLMVASVVAAASFGFNVFTVGNDPSAAFYSPLSRAWELMLGAGLALSPASVRSFFENRSNLISVVGFGLITLAIVVLNSESTFPGWWALAPAAGSLLILSAGPHTFLNRILFARRPAVLIGKISYPLYLWHWPILSFAVIVLPAANARLLHISGVVLAFVLATLTYLLIESPIRTRPGVRLLPLALASSMAVIAIAGFGIYLFNGLNHRFPAARNEFLALAHYDYFTEGKFTSKEHGCFLIDEPFTKFDRQHCLGNRFPGHPSVFLLGDSYMAFLSTALKPAIEARNLNVSQFNATTCPPLLTEGVTSRCRDIYRYIDDKVGLNKPAVIIFFANYTVAGYNTRQKFDAVFPAHIRSLLSMGAGRIVVIGQFPAWEGETRQILARTYLMNGLAIPPRTYAGIAKDALDLDSVLRAHNYGPGVTYISLKDLLCDKVGCMTSVGSDLTHDLVTFDGSHLTRAGAQFVTDHAILDALDNVVAGNKGLPVGAVTPGQ